MTKIKQIIEAMIQGFVDGVYPPTDKELESRRYIATAKLKQRLDSEGK